MSNIVVIYESKYGSTKKYAQWISEEMKADLFERAEINIAKLKEYDTIVYGGGLYASGIAGISMITKNHENLKDKRIIVYTVGVASTDREEVFIPIIKKNFSKEMQENITFFHLRGSLDYKKLGLVHKSMMAMLKVVILKKNVNELSDDDKELLETYGGKVDFVDQNTLRPLILFLRENN